MINVLLIIGYILLLIATTGAILMPIVNAFQRPSLLKKTGIRLSILLSSLLVSLLLASNEVTATYLAYGVNAAIAQLVGGILILLYITFLIAIISTLFTELYGIIKTK